ncbi:SDR family oxidoreductase [Croceicoccus marinus]|uniref:SDR family oxidoreductase n=1 Tax=Croceicoccus marinus TaxID=450378 RepID=A0A7G6VYM3_9SPHN|nr:SDR family oxidoreductase [Croceicoccus marinus]QNE06838.1 SDR family oxidoreductase [Croceicoccus marinus]
MLGYNVRVNSVHPGVVASPMMDGILASYSADSGQSVEDLKAGILQSCLIKRFATPEEVAAATVYLASDAAAYLNGAEQLVDGGYLTT